MKENTTQEAGCSASGEPKDLTIEEVMNLLMEGDLKWRAKYNGVPYHRGVYMKPDWISPLYSARDLTLGGLSQMIEDAENDAFLAVGEIARLGFRKVATSREENPDGSKFFFVADGVNPVRPSVDRTIGCCKLLRKEIKEVGSKINALRKSDFSNEPGTDRGEIIANITLAYRHAEDCAMRLGKAIQALDGGTSVYDKA
jgi:hypothetical protein